MSAAKHTPGPWIAAPLGVLSRDHTVSAYGGPLLGRVRIADVFVGENLDVCANARLIAAAPDLLEAVSDMLRYCICPTEQAQAVFGKARTAIAKAKGGA